MTGTHESVMSNCPPIKDHVFFYVSYIVAFVSRGYSLPITADIFKDMRTKINLHITYHPYSYNQMSQMSLGFFT